MRSVIALAMLLIPACGCRDQLFRQYPTTSDAIAAGEAERGWLPVWLPDEATDIHLQSDLDTNRSWLRFELPPERAEKLKSSLRRVSQNDVKYVGWSRPCSASSWWPNSLVWLDPTDDGGLNAELFFAPADGVVLGFEQGSHRIYSWQAQN